MQSVSWLKFIWCVWNNFHQKKFGFSKLQGILVLPQSPILPGFAIDASDCRGIDAQHLWTTGMWVLLRLGVWQTSAMKPTRFSTGDGCPYIWEKIAGVQFPHNLPWRAASCLPRNCPRLVCQWSLGNIVYSQVEIPFYTQACLCVNQSLYREVWGYRYTSII